MATTNPPIYISETPVMLIVAAVVILFHQRLFGLWYVTIAFTCKTLIRQNIVLLIS